MVRHWNWLQMYKIIPKQQICFANFVTFIENIFVKEIFLIFFVTIVTDGSLCWKLTACVWQKKYFLLSQFVTFVTLFSAFPQIVTLHRENFPNALWKLSWNFVKTFMKLCENFHDTLWKLSWYFVKTFLMLCENFHETSWQLSGASVTAGRSKHGLGTLRPMAL